MGIDIMVKERGEEIDLWDGTIHEISGGAMMDCSRDYTIPNTSTSREANISIP